MIFAVPSVPFLKGKISLPSSKSYSIRAFMIASCGGNSKIINPSNSDDARVAISIAKSLGAYVRKPFPRKNVYQIEAFKTKKKLRKIHVKESGTVLRFLLPLLAQQERKVIVTGEGTLTTRPNFDLIKTLRDMGAHIDGKGSKGCVPIEIAGGCLKGGRLEVKGDLSSQFISSLLITCPSLKENTHLIIRGKQFVSQTYVIMTQQILKKAGIHIHQKENRLFEIRGKQKFRGLKNFIVPADYGLAAFFMAGAAFTHSDVTLEGHFNDEFIQADGQIISFLQSLGVRLVKTASTIKISGPFSLKGGRFSLKNCPDLVPIMSVLALFARGKTRLYDIKHVRVKESDRISDLRRELTKIGAKVVEGEDELIIYPQTHYRNNCLLDPRHDHRLAMAFCILGLKLGVRVKDIECTSKSYPDFVRDLRRLRVPVFRSCV